MPTLESPTIGPPAVQNPAVETAAEFVARWHEDQNFLIAPGMIPLAFKFPSLAKMVDRLRKDEATELRNGAPGSRLNTRNVLEGFIDMRIEDAITRPFGIGHFKLERFYGSGDLLDGFEEQVMLPCRQWFADQGFTWHRCYPIIFISGPGCATNYHVDRSHVLAWQVYGHKDFCSLVNPGAYYPMDAVREKGGLQDICLPPNLTEAETVSHPMPPGSMLWNALLTPHWVHAGDEAAMSVNISFGGLRYRGQLCPNADALHAWYRKSNTWF